MLRPKAMGLTQRKFIQESRKLFHDIAVESGHVIMAWSGLHAAMLRLLLLLFPRAGTEGKIPLHSKPEFDLLRAVLGGGDGLPSRIWRAMPSERLQRQILLETAEAVLWNSPNKHLLIAIKWAVDRADDLAAHRNDVTHVPLLYDSWYRRPARRLRPDWKHSGRNPQRLLDLPNLTTRYRHIATDLQKLTVYVYTMIEICEGTADFDEPLPLLPHKPTLRLAGRSNRDRRNRQKPSAKR